VRKLMWLTLGFGAACGLSVYFLSTEFQMIAMVCLFVAALIFRLMGRINHDQKAAAMVLLGCALGFGWYQLYSHNYLNNAVLLHEKTQVVAVRTSDYSYETAYGTAVDGCITIEDNAYQVRAYLDLKEELPPGTLLQGPFRFRVTTPEGMNTSHSGSGIFLLAYQQDELSVTAGTPESLRERAAVLRRQIQRILEDCFAGDVCAFVKALLLGDTGDLSYGLDTDLKISGIRHVAAVSGLHVSYLFAIVTAVTFRKRFLTAAVGFPLLTLFAAVAGFTPSVTRACLMSGLMLLALVADREYDRPTALSFAALVMLLGNPMVITSVSFQLSVASVAGILLFEQPIRRWLAAWLRLPEKSIRGKSMAQWFTSSISVTVSATVLTAPLCAWYFGTVSLIGVLTNLLTLWVISLIFCALAAVCLLYPLWETGAVLLAKVVAIPVRYVLFTAGCLADFPLAAVYTKSVYIVFWLVFIYLLLSVFLLSRDKHPAELICCMVLSLCAALTASWMEPALDATRLTVLDVGQGQCILLQSEGRTFLVDCGGDSDSDSADLAAETLLSQGISRIDGLILTHMDRDHAGGAANLLSRVDADVLILPPEYSELGETWEGNRVFASDDLTLSWGNTVLSVYASDFSGSSNENSLCILFDTEKCDILITGDRNALGERMLLRRAEIGAVDVLIAGHHGSKNSTGEELLRAVEPEVVCISVGADNSYGHPSPELLQRLQSFGCTVYRTDQNGTIIIRR